MLLLFFLAAIAAYPVKRGIVDDLNSLLNLVIPALNGNNVSNVRVIPVNVARIQGVNTASTVSDTSASTSGDNSGTASTSATGTGSTNGMIGTSNTGSDAADTNSGIAVLPIKAGTVSGIAIIPVPAQSKVAAVNKTPVGSGRLASGEADRVISVNPGRRFND